MLRIQKRTALPVWKSWLIRAIAIIIALVLNGVLIYGLTKMNPVKVYATMFNGVSAPKGESGTRFAIFQCCCASGSDLLPHLK